MKRILTTLLLALVFISAAAQTRSEELEYLKANPICTYGFNDIVHFDVPALTPAPKGYEAFHISHYGRHGSRYAWNRETYKTICRILEENRDKGNLTETGLALCEAYIPFCAECEPHTGELTRKGWNQHMEIARRMYKSYPSIFKNDPKIDAAASSSPRAILSMSAFCLSLGECRKGLDIYEQVTPTLFDETIPDSHSNPSRLQDQPRMERPDLGFSQWWENAIDWDGILSRIFVDGGKSLEHRHTFVQELYIAVTGLNSLDKEYIFPEVLTAEDILNAYKLDCAGSYRSTATCLQFAPLISSLLETAEAAIGDKRPTVRLRFGHDYVFQQYLRLAGINGYGEDVEDYEDLIIKCPAREIPMGANIQFVFYRNRKGGDILVKAVLNGKEAKLPLEPVCGPYYRWSDYKAYLASQISGVVK